MSSHDGEDHSLLLPRAEEAETEERLDRLLAALQDSNGARRRELIAAHAAAVFAGIEIAPGIETWPLVPTSSRVSARWVQAVIGNHLDRIILRMLDTAEGCTECLLAWVKHLVQTRVTISEWAWARDADDLLT
jgi:hypothetical protein